jgi:tetratricopeptide (TPR) repeat protein
MRRVMLTLSGLAASLLLATVAPTAEPRIGKFVRYDTGDFVIVTSRSGAQAREIIQTLVKFRLTLEKLLGRRAARSGIGTHIVLVSTADWEKYLTPRDKVAGFFNRSMFDNYMAMNGDVAGAIYVMLHEYAHFYLSSQFAGEYPPWFDEGLAEVMAYAKFGKDNRAVLQIPQFRVVEARDQDWIPFERLIKVDHHSPEYQQHKLASSFYAQAWLTVHYGLLENRDFGRRMMEYLTALNTLVPHEEASRRHFGEDLGAVDESLRNYARKGRMSSGALDLGAVPEVTLPPPQPMSDGDALAALIDVMLVTRRDPDRTRPLVESLKRREPDAARSHILAARLAFFENDYPAFEAAVDKAATLLKPDDQAGRRELGTVLLNSASDYGRLNTRTTEQTDRDLKRALRWFAEAVERNNDDARALWGLGTTLTRLDSQLDLADTALQAAYQHVPASAAIATSLANLKHRQEKPEEAVRYLNDAIRFADDLSLRRWATESLERTQEYIAERKRIDEENRRQREAYEKQLAEYEKKYGKQKKRK